MAETCFIHKLECLTKHQDAGIFIMRLITGLFFALHGIGKIWGSPGLGPGWEGWSGMIGGLTGGAGPIFAVLVAYGELIVGILLIIGLMTRYAAIYGTIILIAAMVLVKFQNGFTAAELDLLYVASFITLIFTGPGRLSLDAKCKCGAHKKNKK